MPSNTSGCSAPAITVRLVRFAGGTLNSSLWVSPFRFINLRLNPYQLPLALVLALGTAERNFRATYSVTCPGIGCIYIIKKDIEVDIDIYRHV
ncbi:hypothetical protein KQX54_017412 [Cotesia glomerata]|uniref:Uncharacterized protein n=1 Tax=Cotesia glomerata TaxID=32391 RepID=A0AAV7HFM9_COTGL|nr:hypothetical protein KQX54_017412 [Cotesia glomerata]